MAISNMLMNEIATQPAVVVNTVDDYVFETPITLPAGRWELHIEKGEAWVFSARGNVVLNTNATVLFVPQDGDICIKRLYVKSIVKFQATQLS